VPITTLSVIFSERNQHVLGLGGQVGVAVAEVREGLLGCLREIVSGGHFNGAGADHLIVFDECGNYLHGGSALCCAPT
jgi:hypothetical protein